MLFSTVALTSASFADCLAEDVVELSLKTVVEKAIQNNPDVYSQRHRKNAQFERKEAAVAAYYPSIDFGAESGWENTNDNSSRSRSDRADGKGSVDYWRNQAELNVTQMLYDGGRTKFDVLNNQKSYEVDGYTEKEVIDNVALEATTAFLNVVANKQLVAIARQNVNLHKVFLAQMKERFSYKMGSEGDVEQARARLFRAEDRLHLTRRELNLSYEAYRNVVNEEFPKSFKVNDAGDIHLEYGLLQFVDQAHLHNPSLLRAKQNIEAEEASVKRSKSQFLPEVDLELGFDRSENSGGTDGADNVAKALVSLSYNLYNGGADNARKRESIELLESAKKEYDRQVLDVENLIHTNWVDYETGKKRVEVLEGQVASTRIVLKTYREEFNLGKRSLLDVLDTESELFRTQIDLVRTRSNLEQTKIRLYWASGLILNTFNIS